jgi:glycosyltransferase involved in cell wall biosynthesis
MMSKTIDLVMVAYNEAESIEKVLRAFYDIISKHAKVKIIVAEDGSTDGTRDILIRLTNELPLKLVLAGERRGYTKAVNDAIKAVTNESILFMDADGQYLPEDFPTLFTSWVTDEKDMIIGEKFLRKDPPHRIFTSWIYNSIVSLLFNVPFKDMNCSYRFIKKELAQTIAPQCKLLPYSYWTEFTVRAQRMGYKVSSVPIRHRDRLSGTSRIYPTKKLPYIAIQQLKGLSILYKELFPIKYKKSS